MESLYLLLAVVLAYLLGSVPFAVVVSKLAGLKDPRTFGSGNPGATNVLRSGNKWAAAATLLLDAAKGWLPVALAGWLGPRWGLWEGAQAAVGFAAFAGHVWPVYLRFKGGKGVAVALGVLLGISPWLGLLVLASWVAVLLLFRYSSLAALVAAVLAPVYYVVAGGQWWAYDRLLLLGIVLMAALLVWRHAGNINRLLRGEEPKVGSRGGAAVRASAPTVAHRAATGTHPFSGKKRRKGGRSARNGKK